MNTNRNNFASNVMWVIYFVGFDDSAKEGRSVEVEPFVGFERVETDPENAEKRRDDAQLAALLRGGHVLAVVDEDDREKAEAIAHAFEKEILRIR